MSDQAASRGHGARPLWGRWALRHARLTSEQLARAVARGREDAFAEIYRRHHQELYRYCLSILRNGEEAEDALQSTMTKAFAAMGARERDLAVRPWLFRIAHNEAITLLRRRRREDVRARQMAIETVETLGLAPEQAIEQRERMATLLADLAALAERQRGALLMRELSGLSIEEIAGALATTPGAAKQALFEARHALREFAEGRSMDCESVQRLIGEHDGRVLRSRRVRSHLRACASCAELERSIAQRHADLRALAPPLPAVVGSAILARLLAGAGIPHGLSGIASAAGGSAAGGSAAGGSGAAGVAATTGSGAAGVAATTGGVASGPVAAIVGSVAAKAALGTAIIALAAAGAVHMAAGGRHPAAGRAGAGVQRHGQGLPSRAALDVGSQQTAVQGVRGPGAGKALGPDPSGAPNSVRAADHRPAPTRASFAPGKPHRGGSRWNLGGSSGRHIHPVAALGAPKGRAHAHAGKAGAGSKAYGHEHAKGSGHSGQGASRPKARGPQPRSRAKGHQPPSGPAGASHKSAPGRSPSHESSHQAAETQASHHGQNGSGKGATSSESSSTSTTASASQSHGHH